MVSLDDIRGEALRRCRTRYGNVRAEMARDLRVQPQVLCSFLTGKRTPGPQLLRALGYERVSVIGYWRKAEESDAG